MSQVNATIHVSASGLERDWNCTGAPLLREGLPKEPPSAAGTLGTFKHKVVLGAVQAGDPAEVFNLADDSEATFDQVKELEEHAKTLLEVFAETRPSKPAPYIETKLVELEELGMVPTGREGEFQCDMAWEGTNFFSVLDYKSGKTPVEVKGNKQLMAYAWAWMKKLGLLNSDKPVMLWIYQPEVHSWPSNHLVQMEELRKFGSDCAGKIMEMETGGQLAEGPWCIYCPVDRAKACPLKQQGRERRQEVKESAKTQAAEIGQALSEVVSMEQKVDQLLNLPKVAADIRIPEEVVFSVERALRTEADMLAVDKGNALDASDHLKVVGTLADKLEEVEMLTKKPYADAKKAVEDAFRQMRDGLKAAKLSLKNKIATHLQIEERKRQAELQRQKEEQDRIARELKAKEEAAAKLSGQAAKKAQEEAQALRNAAAEASVVKTPPPVKASGVKLKEEYSFVIPQVGKIPDRYLLKQEGPLEHKGTATVKIVEVDFATMAKDAKAGRLDKADWVEVTVTSGVSAK